MIKTERLTLRPTKLEDAAFVLELMNTKGWLDNIGDRKVYTFEAAEEYIKVRMFPQYEKLGYGNYSVLLGDIIIGSCGVYNREGMEYDDLGFAFLDQYQGKGYAEEAALAVMNHVYLNFNIDIIQAITLPVNKPSIKLLERLGFELVKLFYLANDPEELMLMQMSLSSKYNPKDQ